MPLRRFERLVETYLAYAPAGLKSFGMAIPVWLKEKVRLPHVMRPTMVIDEIVERSLMLIPTAP